MVKVNQTTKWRLTAATSVVMVVLAIGLAGFGCAGSGTSVQSEDISVLIRKVAALEAENERVRQRLSATERGQADLLDTIHRLPESGGGAILGDPLISSEVRFMVNDYQLDAEDQANLDKIAKWMAQYPKSSLQILGHADQTGPAFYNMQLSDLRAKAALRYFVEQYDIPLRRMDALPYGSDKPAYSDQEFVEGWNRRIELKLYQAVSSNSSGSKEATPVP